MNRPTAMQNTEDSPVAPDTPPLELSLPDILANRSSVLWHEAVGLVLAVAEASDIGGSVGIPPVEAVFLSPDGSLRIDAHGGSRSAPVPQLRRWLHDLLQESPAPPPLVDLAEEAETSTQSLEAFLEALRYFSRPNRQEELAALARRINAEREVAPIEQELAVLTARLNQPKDAESGRRHAMFPWLSSLISAVSRNRVIGLAVAGAVLALAFPLATWQHWPGPAPLPSSSPWSQDLVAPIIQATPAQQRVRPGRPMVAVERRGAAPRVRAGESLTPLVPAGALPAPLATAVVPKAVPVGPSFTEAPAAAASDTRGASAAPVPAPDRVFTPDDADVAQPVLLSSSLPSPTVLGTSTGVVTVIDLVIDEHGRVERATLASADVRHEERMLLSAVKAWRFRPATRHGVPVKYRARVTLTL